MLVSFTHTERQSFQFTVAFTAIAQRSRTAAKAFILNTSNTFKDNYNPAEKCFSIFHLCLEPVWNMHHKYSKLIPHWHSVLVNRSALCQYAATSMDNTNEQLFSYNSS